MQHPFQLTRDAGKVRTSFVKPLSGAMALGLSLLFLANMGTMKEYKPVHEILFMAGTMAKERDYNKTVANTKDYNQSNPTTHGETDRSNNTKILQQEISIKHSKTSASCEDQAGPYDVCVTGTPSGGNFNNFILLAHALQDVRRLAAEKEKQEPQQDSNSSSSTTTTTSNSRGVVRMSRGLVKWYLTWFREDRSVVDVLPRNKKCMCPTHNDYQYYFYFKHIPREGKQNNLAKLEFLHDLDQTSMTQLYGLLRQDFAQQAQAKLEEYRAMIPQSSTSNNSSRSVITVHARWLDGTCKRRHRDRINFCLKDINPVPASWRESCYYTEDYVRKNLPSQYNDENSIIVLFGDGQRNGTESTFQIRDDSPFQVQIFMMIYSDYHFANPQSSSDKVVSCWRPNRNLRTFPEDCYERDRLPQ